MSEPTVQQASRPKAAGDPEREYHLWTKPGDISPLCLEVGAPERAKMIAETFFKDAVEVGDHRGLRSYTGWYGRARMSVVTTSMGAPCTGIVTPEAYRCGGRIFIRVGSCSTLLKEPKPGDVIIVNAAARFEGASASWAMPEYPAVAHHRIVAALEDAAARLAPGRHYTGVEATTDCFNEGQARPNVDGDIPQRMLARHEELLRIGAACYSMEAAALFIWCMTHRGGLPAGAINAVYGNRRDNSFEVAGDEIAAEIALGAMAQLSESIHMARFMCGEPKPLEA